MSKIDQGQGPPPYPPPAYSYEYGGAAGALPGVATGPQRIITTVTPLGPSSTRMVCPSCRVEMTTFTIKKPGIIAYVSGAIIALLGCFLGCCFIPCCIDGCMDVHHHCPNCGSYLGRYSNI